ncbi:MAG TPA: glycerate kinase [Puia sp.]|jgi:glycerate kinase|nr:glycerate kinase [Puia sp.]
MHILIAPNAFKNSLPADAAAAAMLNGLGQSGLHFTGECFPVGDGGDGTGDLLIERLGAISVKITARDPLGRNRPAYFGLTGDGRTAIIEMAAASGLRLLDNSEIDPLRATSCGTGDLILAALDRNVKSILLGIGGSATVDGGMGILTSLGIRFLDSDGRALTTPASLIDLTDIEASGLDPRLQQVRLTILCDVENPMLGPSGAAAVFGPQKGASPEDVVHLEAALQRLSGVIYQLTGTDISALPLGGAAGAAAAGLQGLLGARLVNGIDYFLEITGFDKALDRSDLVLTGEGSIDEQTLHGKAPFGVAARAKKRGLPVIALAGRLPLEKIPQLDEYFDALFPINHEVRSLEETLANTSANLTATARALGGLLKSLQ